MQASRQDLQAFDAVLDEQKKASLHPRRNHFQQNFSWKQPQQNALHQAIVDTNPDKPHHPLK